MLVAIPGTVVAIRRKPKQEKEFGRRLQLWHPRPFPKEVEMPARRLSMRKIRETLRLLWECELSQRQVAACCGLSKGAVAECAARARRSGIDLQSAATMSDAELEGLQNYLKKGGFIIFDDFRGNHIDNLFFQMRRVMPGSQFQKLDVSHPIFHSFFEIKALDPDSGYYARMGATEWFGMFEDNDPQKRLLAIANNNHDLGELWEFSDTGYMPVDLSNEAYKFGVNYVVYGMTH